MRGRSLAAALLLLLPPALARPAIAATTWSPTDKAAAVTVGPVAGIANLLAETRANNGAWATARGTTSHNTGVYYFEGFFTRCNQYSDTIVGIANGSQNLTAQLGATANGLGIWCNKTVQTNNTTLASPGGPGFLGYLVGVVVDLGHNMLWLTTDNGTNWNYSTSNNPCTNTGGYSISGIVAGGAVFPAMSGYSQASTDIGGVILNTGGAGPFTFAVPSCATPWDGSIGSRANQFTPGQLVPAASGAYSDYSGSDSTAVLSNGNLTGTADTTGNNNIVTSNYSSARYTGSWYFEGYWNVASGSTVGKVQSIGVASVLFNPLISTSYGHVLGADPQGVAGVSVESGQWIYTNTGVNNQACNIATGGTIGIAAKISPTSLTLWCTPDGVTWKPSGSPGVSGGLSLPLIASNGIMPAATIVYGTASSQITLNYGASPFAFPLPAGFCAWNNAARGAAPFLHELNLTGAGH
jgi:hypothetical protein